MKTSVLAAAVLVVLAAGAAKAQDGKTWPCKADAEKFCKDVKPGEGRIIACLKEHQADLSADCKENGLKRRNEEASSNEPCKADMEKFCKDAKAANGGKMQCMKEHEKDLSEACKARMEAGRQQMMKKNPCMADMQKFCKGIKPGGGRLMDCMKQHEADCSDACKAGMVSKKAEMAKKHPCIPDIEKFCKDVKPGEGRIVACLKQHEDELSEGCRSLKDSDRMMAPMGGHKAPPNAVRSGGPGNGGTPPAAGQGGGDSKPPQAPEGN
jgi:hypothetical protein